MNLPAPHLHHNDYDYGCAYNWVAIRKWHNTWFSNYLVVIFHNFIFSGHMMAKWKNKPTTTIWWLISIFMRLSEFSSSTSSHARFHTFNWRITVARWHLEPNTGLWWGKMKISEFHLSLPTQPFIRVRSFLFYLDTSPS